MVRRSVLVVALLALVAGATTAQVVDHEAIPKPERLTTCWECHGNIAVEGAPPLTTFVNIVPPEARGGLPGVAFDYPVQVQNAWWSQLVTTRVTIDLTKAPSVGFASDVLPVQVDVHQSISVDPADPLGTHDHAVVVPIPEGESRMEARLMPRQPASGAPAANLDLLVYPPTTPRDGPAWMTIDDAGPGGEEVFTANRSTISAQGYGDWIFVARGQLASPDRGVSLVGTDGGIPFDLSVHADAEAKEDRVASALVDQPVPKLGSATVPFRLVAVGLPAPGETITFAIDVWAYYDHKADATDDHENATVLVPKPVLVLEEGGSTMLRGEPGTATIAAGIQNGPSTATVSEAIGYATAFLLVSSITTGGMFGKASRRGLNSVFGLAKRRVAFHNFLSYGILLTASVHTTLFVLEAAYHWTLGLIWGGGAVLALLGLGVTGAIQVPLIRSWGYGGWRWTHYGLAVGTIVLTIAHLLLDGVHFADVQNAVGWQDPLDARDLS